MSDLTDQSSGDELTGVDFVDGVLIMRRKNGSTLEVTIPEASAGSPLDDAVAAWVASEYSGVGNFVDRTGNGYDLTMHADLDFAVDHFVVTGANIYGGAVALSSADKPSLGNSFTAVSVWKFGDNTGWGYILDTTQELQEAPGWALYRDGSNGLRFQGWPAAYSPDFDVDATGLTFGAAVQSFAGRSTAGVGTAVLVDGVVVDTDSAKNWSDDSSDPLQMGRYMPEDSEFYGAALFDSSKSDAEIAAIAAAILA